MEVGVAHAASSLTRAARLRSSKACETGSPGSVRRPCPSAPSPRTTWQSRSSRSPRSWGGHDARHRRAWRSPSTRPARPGRGHRLGHLLPVRSRPWSGSQVDQPEPKPARRRRMPRRSATAGVGRHCGRSRRVGRQTALPAQQRCRPAHRTGVIDPRHRDDTVQLRAHLAPTADHRLLACEQAFDPRSWPAVSHCRSMIALKRSQGSRQAVSMSWR